MKKGRRKKQDRYVDEHTTPTEPLPDITATLFQPSTQSEMPVDRTVPVSLPPYGGNLSQSLPVFPSVHSPMIPAIPYSSTPIVQVQGQKGIKGQRSRKRSFLPIWVSLFFMAVQLLLAVRFVVQLLSLPETTGWVEGVIITGELFVWPLQLLWYQVPTLSDIPVTDTKLYTLVAIITYGVLSRFIVRLLKFVLDCRA
jgi:hypothetical protein